MITWRGKARVKQMIQGHTLDRVRVRVAFEVYDDESPGNPPLAVQAATYAWPLEPLRGLTFGQLANLILNVGYVIEVPASPPYPATTVGPDPPPLREVGAQFLEDFTDSRQLLDVPLPRRFGP